MSAETDRPDRGVEEGEEVRDDSEMWEPPLPDGPIGPEGVPKEDDPGPDA